LGKGSKARSKQRSANPEPNKDQTESPIKATKQKNKAHDQQALPYGLMNKPSQFEPSNGLDSLSRTYRHRIGRLNDWHETYGQGMYE